MSKLIQDTDSKQEIVVTETMIDAGVSAMAGYIPKDPYGGICDRDLVTVILLAAFSPT